MKKILVATLLCTLSLPALAGGPVIIEEPEVVAERPATSINPIVIPLLLVLALGVAASSGGSDPVPVEAPGEEK